MGTNFVINKNSTKINFEKRKNSFFELNQNNGSHYQFTVGLYNLFNPSSYYSTYNHFIKFNFDVNFYRLKDFPLKINLNQLIIKFKNYSILRKAVNHNDMILSCGIFDYLLLNILPLRKNVIICIHSEAKYFRNDTFFSWLMWMPLYLIIKFRSHQFLFVNYFSYLTFKKRFPKTLFHYIFHPYKSLNKIDAVSGNHKYIFSENDVLVVGAINKIRYDEVCISKLQILRSNGFNLILVGYIQNENILNNIQKYFVRFYLNNNFESYSKLIGNASLFFIYQPDNFTASSTFLDVTTYCPSFSTIYSNDNAYIDEIIESKKFNNIDFVKI